MTRKVTSNYGKLGGLHKDKRPDESEWQSWRDAEGDWWQQQSKNYFFDSIN